MNPKRGLKRITLTLATVTALLCGATSINIVGARRESAKCFLVDKEGDFSNNYASLIDQALDLEYETRVDWESTALNMQIFRRNNPYNHLADAEVRIKYSHDIKEIQKLNSGFWVRLSKPSFVALCVAAGLVGGLAGFSGAWLFLWFPFRLGVLAIYSLIRWLIIGFCDDLNSKQVESIHR